MIVLAGKRQNIGHLCFGFLAPKGAAGRLTLVVDAKHKFAGVVKVQVRKPCNTVTTNSMGVSSSFNSRTW
jgi:hypothetical protein